MDTAPIYTVHGLTRSYFTRKVTSYLDFTDRPWRLEPCPPNLHAEATEARRSTGDDQVGASRRRDGRLLGEHCIGFHLWRLARQVRTFGRAL